MISLRSSLEQCRLKQAERELMSEGTTSKCSIFSKLRASRRIKIASLTYSMLFVNKKAWHRRVPNTPMARDLDILLGWKETTRSQQDSIAFSILAISVMRAVERSV